MQHAEEAPLVTRREAASLLGISVDSLDRLVANQELVVLRFGRAVRIPRGDVLALIERRRRSLRRPRAPRCSRCQRRIVGLRLVVEERWMCARCVYELERAADKGGERRD